MPEPQPEQYYAAQRAPDRAVVAALLRLSAIPKDDWEECIPRILQVDSEVLALGRVSYWSLRDDPTLLHCDIGYVASPQGFERGHELLEARQPAYFAALRQNEIIEVEDVHSDPRTAEMSDYLTVREITSLLDIPIYSRGRLVGILCHEHTGAPRRWSAADLEFATAVAQIVSAALEAHARSEAERAQRAAVFLDRVSHKLSAAHDVATVAREALECAVPHMGDWGIIDVLDHGEFVRAGTCHKTAQGRALLAQMGKRFPPRAGGPHLTAHAIELEQAVIIPDIGVLNLAAFGMTPEHARMVHLLGARAAIAAPLTAGGRVIGAVLLASAERTYNQADLRRLEEFALRVALALENARLHTAERDAIAARDEFIALAAHELHGPLASLQLAAESLAARASSSPPEAIARLSTTLVRQSHRLNRLVDHMLDASRVIAHRLTLAPERVDLSALTREIADSFRERVEQSGSELVLDVAGELTAVCDGDRLAQVITNLLDNAIKFGEGKPIELSLRRDDGQAVLVVKDHGIGIPPERLPTIFDRFERAVSARSYGGLGLGLFTSKAIVEAHGGSIAVESEVGRGTTLTVRLPLAPEAPATNGGGGG